MDPPPSSTLTGTLVKNRKVSKHLAFADLLLADTAEHIELVIKTSDEIPCVKTAMKGARLGDTVDVLGAFESANGRDHRSFKLAAPYVVVSRWAATSALPFTPVFTLCQATAGAAENAGTVLCKYYTAEKACPRGESCPYVHTEDKEMRGEYVHERAKRVNAAPTWNRVQERRTLARRETNSRSASERRTNVESQPRSSKCGTSGSKRAARRSKGATNGSKRAASGPRPATSGLKRATSGPKPTTSGSKRATSSPKRATSGLNRPRVAQHALSAAGLSARNSHKQLVSSRSRRSFLTNGALLAPSAHALSYSFDSLTPVQFLALFLSHEPSLAAHFLTFRSRRSQVL